MAIDFSQVKTVTIPEGSVKKITDSNGAVLWKENIVGWHTVWEGSQKIGYGGYTGREFLFATEPYSDTFKIRVSFSSLYTWMPSGDDGYSNYAPSNKKSPVTYTSADINTNTKTLVLASIRNSTREVSYKAVLSYNKKTGKIYGSTTVSQEEYAKAYMVITKIEVYS